MLYLILKGIWYNGYVIMRRVAGHDRYKWVLQGNVKQNKARRQSNARYVRTMIAAVASLRASSACCVILSAKISSVSSNTILK